MPQSHPELLDELVFDAMVANLEVVKEVYPETAILESALRLQFLTLTPQQQMQIVEAHGSDWYIKFAAKMTRQLRRLS